MTRQELLDQAHIATYSDNDLLTIIGYLWEEIKRIDERMKADGHIIRVTEELKQYKDENYLDNKRDCMARLRAARTLAQARGLKFELKGNPSDEE